MRASHLTTAAVILVIIVMPALTACLPMESRQGSGSDPAQVLTDQAPGNLQGMLASGTLAAEIAGRQVALCRVTQVAALRPAACAVQSPAVTTGAQGQFRFEDVPPGDYLLVMDSGQGDFGAALAAWENRPLRPGDWAWLRDEFLGLPEGDAASVPLPLDTPLDRAAFATQTLLIGASPFVLAHRLDESGGLLEAAPLTITAAPGVTTGVVVTAAPVAQQDLDAVRAQIGPLSREEVAALDRALVERWDSFLAGDGRAFRDTDALVILALRGSGQRRAYQIGETQLTAVEEMDGELVKRVGYLAVDVQSGDTFIAGWLDTARADVIEARTLYRLNVRDDYGEWIEAGPDGEQWYHYGFSYYRRWGQVLPDPVIAVIADFYDDGVAYVGRHLAEYSAAAESFGGDLRLLEWDAATLEQMQGWAPSTPPFVHLPDSGTVDIRRERFLEALTGGAVIVEERGLGRYLGSDEARSSPFVPSPDPQEVRDALLIPYRSGHLFSDLEAAIILDATYGQGSTGPLLIRISTRLEQGFQVPRNRDREILVAADEVAGVLLGYPGALNSRWAHEMGHIVDFRSEQYEFRGRPLSGSRCEPAKYLMEFMWWVQRYPGDAPALDWAPINSGLTLARLLTEQFHNSGC